MGHIINPISFRLGFSRYWNSTWSLSSLKNYSNLTLQDYLLKHILVKHINKYYFKHFRLNKSSIFQATNLKILRKFTVIKFIFYIYDTLTEHKLYKHVTWQFRIAISRWASRLRKNALRFFFYNRLLFPSFHIIRKYFESLFLSNSFFFTSSSENKLISIFHLKYHNLSLNFWGSFTDVLNYVKGRSKNIKKYKELLSYYSIYNNIWNSFFINSLWSELPLVLQKPHKKVPFNHASMKFNLKNHKDLLKYKEYYSYRNFLITRLFLHLNNFVMRNFLYLSFSKAGVLYGSFSMYSYYFSFFLRLNLSSSLYFFYKKSVAYSLFNTVAYIYNPSIKLNKTIKLSRILPKYSSFYNVKDSPIFNKFTSKFLLKDTSNFRNKKKDNFFISKTIFPLFINKIKRKAVLSNTQKLLFTFFSKQKRKIINALPGTTSKLFSYNYVFFLERFYANYLLPFTKSNNKELSSFFLANYKLRNCTFNSILLSLFWHKKPIHNSLNFFRFPYSFRNKKSKFLLKFQGKNFKKLRSIILRKLSKKNIIKNRLTRASLKVKKLIITKLKSLKKYKKTKIPPFLNSKKIYAKVKHSFFRHKIKQASLKSVFSKVRFSNISKFSFNNKFLINISQKQVFINKIALLYRRKRIIEKEITYTFGFTYKTKFLFFKFLNFYDPYRWMNPDVSSSRKEMPFFYNKLKIWVSSLVSFIRFWFRKDMAKLWYAIKLLLCKSLSFLHINILPRNIYFVGVNALTLTADFLTNYIITHLQKNMPFFKVLSSIWNFLSKLIQNRIIYGYMLRVSGRFKKNEKAVYFIKRIGNIGRSSIKRFVDYSFRTVNLKLGATGFKLWVSFANIQDNLMTYNIANNFDTYNRSFISNKFSLPYYYMSLSSFYLKFKNKYYTRYNSYARVVPKAMLSMNRSLLTKYSYIF